MRQLLPQHVERLLRSEKLECLPVVLVQKLFHFSAICGGESDEDSADRFFRGTTARPGNASDRERVVCAHFRASAFRHFTGDRFTHRSMSRESFRAHANERLLGVIAVGDARACCEFCFLKFSLPPIAFAYRSSTSFAFGSPFASAFFSSKETDELHAAMQRYRKLIPTAKEMYSGPRWENSWKTWEKDWKALLEKSRELFE